MRIHSYMLWCIKQQEYLNNINHQSHRSFTTVINHKCYHVCNVFISYTPMDVIPNFRHQSYVTNLSTHWRFLYEPELSLNQNSSQVPTSEPRTHHWTEVPDSSLVSTSELHTITGLKPVHLSPIYMMHECNKQYKYNTGLRFLSEHKTCHRTKVPNSSLIPSLN